MDNWFIVKISWKTSDGLGMDDEPIAAFADWSDAAGFARRYRDMLIGWCDIACVSIWRNDAIVNTYVNSWK